MSMSDPLGDMLTRIRNGQKHAKALFVVRRRVSQQCFGSSKARRLYP